MKTIDDEIRDVLDRQGEIAAIKHARNRYDLDLKAAKSYVQGMRNPLPRNRPKIAAITNKHKTAEIVGQSIVFLFLILMAIGIYSCNRAIDEGSKRATVERAQAAQNFRNKIENAIREHKAIIGMSPDEAEKAWGYPAHINKSNVLGHLSEQWVYNRGYLYFEGDFLTSIQETQ
jgi:Na+-transporting methylmalonyl-CoA/oxaloacetate decarboxylase gamma subunit